MIQERRANGDVIGYAHDATGKPVGFEYYDNAAGTMTYCYYRHNLQGDITDLCDRRGNSLVHYTYDAWGKLISITGEKASTLGVINPLRYRGYYYDSETGLYYLQSRYYDPEVGRFISADGYVSTGTGFLGYNMYAYCNNDPILLQDSSGSRPILGGGLRDETAEQRKMSLSYISSANRRRYVQQDAALTVEQKMLVATVAGEANTESMKAKKAVAHTIVNRAKEPRDSWNKVKSVKDVLENGGYDAVGSGPYNACMAYLNHRTGNNVYYEYLIASVIPIYYDEEEDFTMGAHFIFNTNECSLEKKLKTQPKRYKKCGPFEGINDEACRMYRSMW